MQRDDDEPMTSDERLAERRREEARAVEEGGGGVSEGFELSEEELIEHASHGDQHGTSRVLRDARTEEEDAGETHGEADSEVIEDA